MSVKPVDSIALLYQQAPSDGKDHFNELPTEIVYKIFDQLTDDKLISCHRVCRKWEAITSSEDYLRARYKEPAVAFGKDNWERHIGKVGEIPGLPKNINEILESPCPIWEGKKIKDTHVLVYIPTHVNGQPHTLNNIGKLVPMDGKQTGYKYFAKSIVRLHGDTPAEKGEWILMTKDILPKSGAQRNAEQQTFIETLSAKAKAKYQVPKLIEAITCIFAQHLRSKELLYHPYTFTRCQETEEFDWDVVVGGFDSDGLHVCSIWATVGNSSGVAAVRKLQAPES